ncbi:MAG: PAS domain-containing protein, partial [Microvirga sp.]
MRIVHLAVALLAGSLALFASAPPARAVEAVRVSPDVQAIDLTPAIERYRSDGDEIRISTAPGRDGIVRRIAVKARETGTRPDWIVFALTNDTDEQLDRLLVAPHFRLVGSGVIWPDLGGSRIAAITASQGIRPEREDSTEADVFLMTLDPGTTVTFVAELNSPNVPQIYLWDSDSYRKKTTGLTLYKGIIIGIAGLLALFLTIVFVVKGALIFPAAAALAWAVLAYACIDFGFFQRVFPVTEAAERIYRAAAEAVLAATLLVFLFAYLNLNRWHVRYGHVTFFWLIFLAALVGLAVVDPPVASGVARISIAAVAGVGFLLVVHLATHGYDRAVMLVPTWVLLVAWVAAGAFTVTGSLASDLVQPALIGALVLIVMLIGFTVMQHAFAGGITHNIVTDVERRALALTGAGDMIWDWDVSADRVYTSPETEQLLGLKRGTLDGPASRWLEVLHALDRDRFRAALDGVLDQRRGRLFLEFRLRTLDGHYMWFALKARPVVGSDG